MLRPGILRLLEIKDSDMRLAMLDQARDAVDNGIHAGGAFSATIPLVALYYGGFIRANVEQQPCTGASTWKLANVGMGYYAAQHAGTGSCLDVAGGSGMMGANIQQWSCNDLAPQIWRFDP